MTKNKFEELIKKAKKNGEVKLVVASAEAVEVLKAVRQAQDEHIIKGILVGDKIKIIHVASNNKISLKGFEIIHEPIMQNTPKICCKLINEKKADFLMKGLVNTKDFMKAVFDHDNGLRDKVLISHVSIFEIPTYHKILLVTDAAINIAPTLSEKVEIIQNAVNIAHFLNIKNPKVACICAIEIVTIEKMPATMDAAILAKMNERGQIPGCIVDGPLALDNAISKKACKIKNITSKVGGDADIIMCPDIETANVLYKSLTTLANASVAVLTAGAKVPLVLTSRADSHETKYLSIVLGALCVK